MRKPNLRRAAHLFAVSLVERVEGGFETRSFACQVYSLISSRGREGVRKFHSLAVSISCHPSVTLPSHTHVPDRGEKKIEIRAVVSHVGISMTGCKQLHNSVPQTSLYTLTVIISFPCSSTNSLTGRFGMAFLLYINLVF